MRVSAAQFFAMSPSDRKQVTHIDMDLDREAERRDARKALTFAKRYGFMTYGDEPTAEPGTDWTKP